MMRRRLWIEFALIVLLVLGAGYVSWPGTQNLKIGKATRDVSLRQGLDLKGGAHLVYEADTSKVSGQEASKAMDSVRSVIDSRVNALGVTEPEIREISIGSKPGIIVDLPGVSDVEKAKEIIGSTAKLSFVDEQGNTVVEGKDLVPGQVDISPDQSGSQQGLKAGWQVNLTFNAEGREKFAKATAANIGKTIAILLDDQPILRPTVQSAITDGKAVINGGFTVEQARDLSLKLNYGALPVPISLVQEQSIGPSLGQDAINQSLMAGVIGIALIFLYMIAFYRWPGFLASLSIFVYSLLNIALYKLIPITMTLAGIAGFIISIGIAVDTNILTFERLKEELRLGKPLALAIQEAFKRAWTSIRDSHISGFISAIIIFWLGSGSVRGFALVLLIGTALSLFSAITVTRTWMYLIAGSRFKKILHI